MLSIKNEVDKRVLKRMSKEEIVTHCLWEMTFMGFTQSRIRSRLSVLKSRVKDIKEGKVKTIPFEEVKA
jgi:predicted XRE-type DNA-binding protein